MKKIIIALDGQHFPKGAFEFAKYINSQNEILLAGVFLNSIDYSKILSYPVSGEGLVILPDWLEKDADSEIISKNINYFKEQCDRDGMHYRVHNDNSLMAMASLIEETRFADVLLVSSELFYNNLDFKQPNSYLEELLKKSECPVMIVPENFKTPNQVILSYDAGESSTFAIKQFAYLFPTLTKLNTTLLNLDDDEEEIPNLSLISELAAKHYENLEIKTVAMKSTKFFTDWLMEQPNSYVIMGAFARSTFSQMFKKSFAKNIISEIKMPFFIAHK